MRSSTLLVLLGMSIIAVSIVSFASFVLSTGTTNARDTQAAGSVLTVAVLLGLGQIIVGRALRPAGVEEEKPAKKGKQKLAQPSLSKIRGKPEEEEPHVISVEDQEPAEWLKTTLEKLAEQGPNPEEENVTPAEYSAEPVATSKPSIDERSKPITPSFSTSQKSHSSAPTPTPEFSRPQARAEPVIESKTKPLSPAKPEQAVTSEPEVQASGMPAQEEEEPAPGVRRIREMEITFVERDGITFLEPGTGIHERYPCEDQALIDYAWRALVRGLKVNVDIESGKVAKLTPSG